MARLKTRNFRVGALSLPPLKASLSKCGPHGKVPGSTTESFQEFLTLLMAHNYPTRLFSLRWRCQDD